MPGQSYAYDGVLGGKTGYTDAAGSTLVTYAKRGNSILIAVVLNSTNGAFPDTTSLLDYGFDNFEKVDLNIDTDPVPAVFLPCEKHLLKDWNNLCSLLYEACVRNCPHRNRCEPACKEAETSEQFCRSKAN